MSCHTGVRVWTRTQSVAGEAHCQGIPTPSTPRAAPLPLRPPYHHSTRVKDWIRLCTCGARCSSWPCHQECWDGKACNRPWLLRSSPPSPSRREKGGKHPRVFRGWVIRLGEKRGKERDRNPDIRVEEEGRSWLWTLLRYSEKFKGCPWENPLANRIYKILGPSLSYLFMSIYLVMLLYLYKHSFQEKGGRRGKIYFQRPGVWFSCLAAFPLHSGLRQCPKALRSLDPRAWRDFVSRTVGGPGVGKVKLQKFLLPSQHAPFLCVF